MPRPPDVAVPPPAHRVGNDIAHRQAPVDGAAWQGDAGVAPTGPGQALWRAGVIPAHAINRRHPARGPWI
jgi:hypothetical protein